VVADLRLHESHVVAHFQEVPPVGLERDFARLAGVTSEARSEIVDELARIEVGHIGVVSALAYEGSPHFRPLASPRWFKSRRKKP